MTAGYREPAGLVQHQISVLKALARQPAIPYLPEVVASGTDPLILVTKRVRGSSLFVVVDSIDRDYAGMQLARFLAALHGDEARRRVEAVSGTVPAWYPLATTSALRERFGRWVTPEQQRITMASSSRTYFKPIRSKKVRIYGLDRVFYQWQNRQQ
jgi:hypothetical protein